MTSCAYLDHTISIVLGTSSPTAVHCDGPASRVFHDGRGCAPVCAAHHAWRRTLSQVHGHGRGCRGDR